jgi:salicylate hydroxylase
MPEPLHVLVIGGGIGGLCLAQGLKAAGVSVAVYERTHTRTDWLQGYRIHISPTGSKALHECLSPRLWEAFVATAGKPASGFGFVTEQMRELLFIEQDILSGGSGGPTEGHHSISRITLRQILLTGLDGVVHLGKEFVRYERTPQGKVTAFFADGTAATGDVLVAADGAGSRVRQQYLPHTRRLDLGIVAVAGKFVLNEQTRDRLPRRLVDGPNNIVPKSGCWMFSAVYEAGGASIEELGMGSNDGGGEGERSGLHFDNTQDYVFWAYVARPERYPAADLRSLGGADLQQVVLPLIDSWHPDIRRLVAESDPATVAVVPIRSMAPVEPWESTNLTLLGDAIHNMTPLAGVGANTALRDASLLCRQLTAVDGGETALVPAIHEYEAQMLDYGFAAVRASLRNAEQAVSDNVFARTGFKAFLRACNAIPPLKKRVFGGMGR